MIETYSQKQARFDKLWAKLCQMVSDHLDKNKDISSTPGENTVSSPLPPSVPGCETGDTYKQAHMDDTRACMDYFYWGTGPLKVLETGDTFDEFLMMSDTIKLARCLWYFPIPGCVLWSDGTITEGKC